MARSGPIMMITSTSNWRVKWVRALQAHRGDRWKEKRYILEGSRLVSEVVQAGFSVELVLYTEHFKAKEPELVHLLSRLGGEVQMVSDAVMAACSDTENPAGILVVVPFPEWKLPEKWTFLLVVDRIADPGNLGTILRTAWATGVEAVVLTEESVDPFNPKVVRAGAGAHIYLPVFQINSYDIMDHLRELEVWLAESRSGMAYTEIDWRKPSALIIGSEAHGVDDALRDMVEKRVHIPMRDGVDSLNAAIAASVILFEIARQREAK
jgi:TrmH family RNA methyltransferase